MLDVEALAGMLAPVISEEVEKAIAPLNTRIAELEARKPEAGPPGEKGERGEPGERGADSVAPEPEMIIESCKDVLDRTIKEMLDFAMSELPPPEKGEKGDTGERGETGARGVDGANGRGVKALLIDREGQLVATMDDGEMKSLGSIVGKDGRDGSDGQNAEHDVSDDWGDGLTPEEKSGMVSAMLRKEFGEADLIVLPDPVVVTPVSQAQAAQPVVIHNYLPKRGIEKTVVTKHDERGRIVEYERREV